MILKHLAFLLLGAALGWLFGEPVIGLAVAAVAAVVRHLYYLNKLRNLLTEDSIENLHGAREGWARIFRGVQHLQDETSRSQRINRRLTREWRTITDALPDAGLLLDENFNILQFNESALNMLRIDAQADSGRPIMRVIRNPAFIEAIEQRHFDEWVPFTSARNPDRAFSVRITPFGSGQHILIVRDITDQLRAEKVKTDFVANASHELRTPITVLKGYLHGLSEDDGLAEAWREPVAEMNLHVDRMQSLVADLLRLNRFEGEVDAPFNEVDIGAMIRRACKEARLLGEDVATVGFEVDSDAALLGDAGALQSIVTNLLTNAVRFTPGDGRIAVRWESDEQGGRLSVSDTGIGIDADEIERVTERFYRTDPGRARHLGGSGLGLAIVKHALAMHGGRLQIESEPDSGSVFTCHFPPERLSKS